MKRASVARKATPPNPACHRCGGRGFTYPPGSDWALECRECYPDAYLGKNIPVRAKRPAPPPAQQRDIEELPK